MRRAAVDFAPRRAGPGWGALVSFLACAALFSWSAWEYLAARDDGAELARRLADARAARAKGERERPPPAALSEPAVAAINEAIGQLNLPWADLFSAFESGLPKTVALLALEPDARKGLFKVQAEARTPEDMVDFLARLDAGGRFAEVTLVRHEVVEQDPNRPVRFLLLAAWGGRR